MHRAQVADSETIRQAVQQVYSADEFWWKHLHELEPPSLRLPNVGEYLKPFAEKVGELVSRLLQWLGNFLRRLQVASFPELDYTPGDGLSLLAVLVVVGAIAALLWLTLRRNLTPSTALEQPPQRSLDAVRHDAAKLLTEARQALERGDCARVVRCSLLAVLIALDHLNVISFDPARTNREYALALRRWPKVQQEFRRIASVFDHVHYGRLAIGREDARQHLERSAQLIESLKEQVGGSPA